MYSKYKFDYQEVNCVYILDLGLSTLHAVR